ncbi:MAG: ComF family protein [Clostridiales bacterium]|nr:ComF family protein [Clostridiales bacterium]
MSFDIKKILYPGRCPVCHEVVGVTEGMIHRQCRYELPVITGARCCSCSRKMADPFGILCGNCRKLSPEYEENYGVFYHNDLMSQVIFEYKYVNHREYGEFFAKEIAARAGKKIRDWNPEVILPVPSYKDRTKKRGYNQAEVLARLLSEELGIPFSNKLLFRIRSTVAQKNLGRHERFDNLRRSFFAEEEAGRYKKVLLVDDIYTTGSTINSCALALKKKGVSKIYSVTVSVGSDSGSIL